MDGCFYIYIRVYSSTVGYRYRRRRIADDPDAQKKASKKASASSSSGGSRKRTQSQGLAGAANSRNERDSENAESSGGEDWSAEEVLGLCKLVDACGGRLPLLEMGSADEGLAEYLVPTRTAAACSKKLAIFTEP